MKFLKFIGRIISKIIFVVLSTILVIFFLNNTQIVTLSLSPLPFTVEVRLFLAIIIALMTGILLGSGVSSIKLFREKIKNFFHQRKIKKLIKQNSGLTKV